MSEIPHARGCLCMVCEAQRPMVTPGDDLRQARAETQALRKQLADMQIELATANQYRSEAMDAALRANADNEKLRKEVAELLARNTTLGRYVMVQLQSAERNEYEHGVANGLILALSIMRGGDYTPLPRPDVWGDDAFTLRGRYRALRTTFGRGRIVSACVALWSWAL